MTIAVIDFEIANSKFHSACSVGIVVIEGFEIVKEEYFLIQPPGLIIDEEMSKVHGLTFLDLLSASPFDVIWPKIEKYFNGDYILAAHNAYFDMNVLTNTSLNDNISIQDFLYFDTIQYTVPICGGIGTSLADRCDYFSITLENAHNALDDARATAELIIRATQSTKTKTIEQFLLRYQIPVKEFKDLNMTTEFFKRKNKKKFSSFKVSDLSPDTNTFNENHPLFNQNIVLTGDLKGFTRKEATQAILNVGGIPKSGVSSLTNYLIVGEQDPTMVGSKGISSKEIKAAELIRKGKSINIITEDDFIYLLQKHALESVE